MRFVCPSCAAGNRVPDKCAGITIICRRCKTQITVPGSAARPGRSWLASPRWLAIVGLEVVSLVALIVTAVMLLRRGVPAGLPLVEEAGGKPQVAVPGGSLALEWEGDLESAGGYYRVASANVSLVRGGRPMPLGQPAAADNPWPPDVLERNEAPEPRPIALTLTVPLPPEYTLSGQRVTLQASVEVSLLVETQPDRPLAVQQTTVRREWSFVVATDAQGAEFAAWQWHGRLLRWLAIACAALVVGVPIGATALAQQRVTIKCPECGRTTQAVFYFEGGDYYVSPCPHRGTRAAQGR